MGCGGSKPEDHEGKARSDEIENQLRKDRMAMRCAPFSLGQLAAVEMNAAPLTARALVALHLARPSVRRRSPCPSSSRNEMCVCALGQQAASRRAS